MSAAGTGHKPENLAVGAVLTTLSFFCVAVVGALGKAAGQLTSTAVVVLFQNLICFVIIIPVAIRGGYLSCFASYCAGVSRNACCWPCTVPSPAICPASLMAVASPSTHPLPAGIMPFKSCIRPPLVEMNACWEPP